eukprot:gene10466-3212_t
MGRTRMQSVDLKATAQELNTILAGTRLQNIYDITPRTYLLKPAATTGHQALGIHFGMLVLDVFPILWAVDV